MKTAERTAYLTQVLRMNPVEQAEAIIAARNEFLGVVPAAATVEDVSVVQAMRADMQRRLENLRGRFWTMELDKLKRALRRLDLEPYPDLRAAGERLWNLADHRREFPQLATHKHADPDLFDTFKQVVVLPPREAALLKQQTLAKAVRNPSRLKRHQKMARTMQREFPELFELEADWLTLVLNAKKSKPLKVHQESSGCDVSDDSDWSGWPWWLVGILIFKAVIALMRMAAQ